MRRSRRGRPALILAVLPALGLWSRSELHRSDQVDTAFTVLTPRQLAEASALPAQRQRLTRIAVAASASEQELDDQAWKPAFRSLLLSRSSKSKKAALERLSEVFEASSTSILAELESCAEAVRRWPLLSARLRPFFGYRSACASIYRTMVEHVLPEQAGSSIEVQRRSENGTQRVRYAMRSDAGPAAATGPSEESKARALLVVLRQLVSGTAWDVQAAAQAASTGDGQWLSKTPDLETPIYTVVFKDTMGTFEVREYDPYSVVQIAGMGGEDAGSNRSFFALAGYIFGKKNERQEKMAMTTPVQMDRSTGRMSFIMPSRYWGENLQQAPPPTADAGVQLETRAKETVAVSIFGGYARGPVVTQKSDELLTALQQSDWEPIDGSVRLMQYNDPFTVPWKRRNEVSIAVQRSQSR
mmetsp:Transcript_89952/g.160087  ORF Transcript_89952/g.160087 Transcript_89952/m.160087 type:complete len:414 (+) Transcript_89952:2-1243(+)